MFPNIDYAFGPQNIPGPNLGLLGGLLGGAQNLVSDIVGGTIGGVGNLLGIEGAEAYGQLVGDQVSDTAARVTRRQAQNAINDEFAELGAKNPIFSRNSRALAGATNSGLFGDAQNASDYRRYGIGGAQAQGSLFDNLFGDDDRPQGNNSPPP